MKLATVSTTFFLAAKAMASDTTPKKPVAPFEGGPPIGHIIGGEDAVRGEFPYFAIPYDGLFVCSGALIAKNIILAAAHCVDGFASATTWLVGSTDDLNAGPDPTYQEFIGQQAIFVHPSYIQDSFSCLGAICNDFAIVVLDAEFTNSNVGIIEPAGKDYNDLSGQPYTIMGIGVNASGELVSTMQKAEVFNFDINVCAANYANNGTDIQPDIHICAGAPGIDSCQGDSGAPMVNQDDIIVGLVSFGTGCADPEFPGVYARVSSDIAWDWINEKVCDEASTIPSWANCADDDDECDKEELGLFEWLQCLSDKKLD